MIHGLSSADVLRLPLLAICFLLTASFALAATPEDGDVSAEDDRSGWNPSFWVSIEARQQSASGGIQSTLITGTVSLRDDTGLPADVNADTGLFGVSVPFGIELEAPALKWIPGAPRPFLSGSYQLTPGSDRVFLQLGNPGPVNLPASPTSQGLGVKLSTQLKQQWGASLGLSFEKQMDDLPWRIRPSLDYFAQGMDFEAVVVGIPEGTTDTQEFSMTDSRFIHSMGPRVTFEADTGRRGPLRFMVFLDLAGYFRLGDQTVSQQASEAGQTASFQYAPGLFTFQGGVGTRIVWDPAN